MMGKIRIISFTKAGFGLSDHMAKILESRWEVFQYTTKETVIRENQKVIPVSNGLKKWCESVFFDSDALIFIGACGIAVRTICLLYTSAPIFYLIHHFVRKIKHDSFEQSLLFDNHI